MPTGPEKQETKQNKKKIKVDIIYNICVDMSFFWPHKIY